jgi:hypothetical protein
MDQHLSPGFAHFVGWVVLTIKNIQYENADIQGPAEKPDDFETLL